MASHNRRSLVEKLQQSLDKSRRSLQNRRNSRLTFEALESRQLLSVNPVISELMASNHSTLKDYYGNSPDWLEIYNPDTATVDLSGWKLQDKTTIWNIPSGVTLAAKSYLTIFCDKNNTIAPNGELHTSFNLGASGDYLALLKPDSTVVQEFTPTYPAQFSDVSYGLSTVQSTAIGVNAGSTIKWSVPTSSLSSTWNTLGFNDASWTTGTATLGYDSSTSGTTNANGFAILEKHGGTVSSLSAAKSLLNNALVTGTSYASRTVNFVDPDSTSTGHFGSDSAFGGNTSGGDDDNFALQVRCTIVIPTTGEWTFGVNSDDGFSLQIAGATFNTLTECTNAAGTDTMEYASPRGPNDSFGTATLAAGSYEATLTYYEYGGGSGLEFFAAPGTLTAYDSSFDLVGDTASGGLATLKVSNILGSSNPTFAAAASGVNSTALARIPFTVSNAADVAALTLKMKYDDGFAAYLNGNLIAVANAPATLAWNSAATADRMTGDAVRTQTFDVSDYKGFLVNGANVLAIQLLNTSASDTNLFVSPELDLISAVVGIQNQYFTIPTPGLPNGAGVADLGPIVTNVSTPAVQPTASTAIVVTAKVAATLHPVSTTTVTLHYRVAYDAESTTTMYDDGLHGDGAASDGVYGAEIPAYTASAGQMLRWYVTANDTLGKTGRWPLLMPVIGNDGGPEYEGTVIADPSLSSTLPIFQWFTTDPSGAASDGGARGSVYYLGQFYDNVFIRHRGGWSTTGYKFEFNAGYDFTFAADEAPVNEINVNSRGSVDDTYLRPVLAFQTLAMTGLPTEIAFSMHMELNGSFQNVMYFVEQVGDDFMTRNGLYEDGSLYKLNTDNDGWRMWPEYATQYEKKSRDAEGYSDLQAFFTGLQLTGAAKVNFILDNVDIPSLLDFMAGEVLIGNNDYVNKNFYLYRDTNDGDNAAYGYANDKGTNEWKMLFWDMDLTFGTPYMGSLNFTDFTDPYAHPFFGDSGHTKPDSPYGVYNGLIDALLDIPEIKQMYVRRLRTLMDKILQPIGTPYENRVIENKLDALYAKLMGDADFVGNVGDVAYYFNQIKTQYLDLRRNHLYVDHSLDTSYYDYAGIPAAQTVSPTIVFGTYDNTSSTDAEQEYLTLTNPNSVAVDISGWKLTGGVDFTFAEGTVIPAGGTLYVSPNVYRFRQRTTGPSGGQGLFIVGNYDGHLSKWGESVQLIDKTDAVISTISTAVDPSLVQQYLRVTEVMYHPAKPSSGSYTNDDFQYIELKNISTTQTLNLTGVHFTDGIVFDFTGSSVTSLAPGARVLVVSNLAAFQSRYGTGLNAIIAGQFGKERSTDLGVTHLSKSGEKITLVDSLGETILSFTYDDGWFKQTDKAGNSLVIRDPLGSADLWGQREGWFASHAANGSPGTDETPDYAVDAIVVSEMLTHTDVANPGDWVEFYNTTDAAINIGGWYLSNDDEDLMKYQIAAGTIIPAHGYATFNHYNNFGNAADSGYRTEFSFSEMGGIVFLTSATGTTLTTYQFSQSFDAADRNLDGSYPYDGTATTFSFVRYTKSNGGKDFVTSTQSTYNTANNAPRVGPVVIDEIDYHPTPGHNSFIELKNITGNEVYLYDPDHTNPLNPSQQNPWKLTGGVEFTFPQGASIPANGYALVVDIDPEVYRTKYGISASVPIFGPYLFDLDNGGDSIELVRPGEPQTLPSTKVPYYRVDRVTYDDDGSWPKTADGFGASLIRVSATAYGNDPSNWTAGQPTPGASNSAFNPTPITIATPPSSSPGTVTGTTTTLSVLGAHAVDGEASLYYNWTATGPAAVAFSDNGKNSAKNTTATFSAAGNYTFTVTIVDNGGLMIQRSVTVTVAQTASGITIAPTVPVMVPGSQMQFAVQGIDQFGMPMAISPSSISWNATAGTIVSGLFTAPSSAATVTVTATRGSSTANLSISVVAPKGWWKFDEGSGASTADASGNGNTGSILNAVTWTTGISGNALNFAGSTACVSVPSSTSLNPTSAITLAAWINVDSWTVPGVMNDARIIEKGTSDNQYMLYSNSSTLEFYLYGIGSVTASLPSTGTWHHVAATYAQGDRLRLYVDGVQVAASASTYGTAIATTTNPLYIGNKKSSSPSSGTDHSLRGTIDDVRVYGTALSSSAIAYLADKAPTIGSAATATPNPLNESTTVLSVLGDDDGGEGYLCYTWSATGPASVAFNSNGLNVSKNATATFTKAGTYNITATITDAYGLSVTSSVSVTVNQLPSGLTITPSGSQFVVGGTDQYGNALTASAPFDWPVAGLTLAVGGDAKLHLYQTGTTTDIVPAYSTTHLTTIAVTGRNGADESLTVDLSGGSPIPAGGITFNGGTIGAGSGNKLFLAGSSNAEAVTMNASQITANGSAAISYSNVAFFGFTLAGGGDTLALNNAAVKFDRNNAISSGTFVTLGGGTLDLNGFSQSLDHFAMTGGNLLNGTLSASQYDIQSGTVTATITGNGNVTKTTTGTANMSHVTAGTVTVSNGTLNAVSIVADTLIIGSTGGAASAAATTATASSEKIPEVAPVSADDSATQTTTVAASEPVAVAAQTAATSTVVENAIVPVLEPLADAKVETDFVPTFVPLVLSTKSVSASPIESTVSNIETAPVVADEISWTSASLLLRPAIAVAMPEAPAVSRQLASSAETFAGVLASGRSTTAVARTAPAARSSAQTAATDDPTELQSVVEKKLPEKTGPLQASSLSSGSIDWLFRNGLL